MSNELSNDEMIIHMGQADRSKRNPHSPMNIQSEIQNGSFILGKSGLVVSRTYFEENCVIWIKKPAL